MKKFLVLLFLSFFVIGCATKKLYTGDVQIGEASWYGKPFNGKLTASGERYNMYAYTAAHNSLPFGSIVKVTNLKNNKSVIVRINDRGNFGGNRIIDLSYKAAKVIGIVNQGVAPVKIRVLSIKKSSK